MKKVSELVVGEGFQSLLLIKNAEIRTAKNGKNFISFTFQDSSGIIDGKFWDASDEEMSLFQIGKVVSLEGKKEVYLGKSQVRIINLRLANSEEARDPRFYVKKAPIRKEQMEEEMNQILFDITNPHWNRIVRFLLSKYKEEFFTYPAAKKNHHAFYGGLAYHTTLMLKMAKNIVQYYSGIDASLIYSGIILHDLAKVLELSGPIATEYTLVGNLIGHLVLIDGEILKACSHLKIDENQEDVIVLRHMVLSHHGRLEYGSPVHPLIMEAEILHQLDKLDASLQMLSNAIQQTTPGQYTDRIFPMDNRRFYVPKNT